MDKESLHNYYNEILRNPLEIAGAPISDKLALKKSLVYKHDEGFLKILSKLDINLIISREYEHLLLCFSADNQKIKQSFYPIAHPSGLAINHGNLYVASTRNPNQITEFSPTNDFLNRIEDRSNPTEKGILLPSRIKNYPGATYFHDLVFIGNQLYSTAVGLNTIIPIDFNSHFLETPIWKPNLSKNQLLKLEQGNYLQINSIAAGKSINESFFSASASAPGKYRPGHRNYPVDKKGVIFSANGDVIATGLTRPHSARIFNDKIWVNNSGYGEFGVIEDGKFKVKISLPGWTRGLHFVENYAFVGTSRILPRYEHYAPGLDSKKSISAIFIIDMDKMEIVGRMNFPNGNQIFGIESMSKNITSGFFNPNIINKPKTLKSIFYKFINRK